MDMDWSKALQESLVWLAAASVITVVAFAAVALLVVRFTRWGRQFWQLAGPFLHPRNSWWPLLVFTLLLVLALVSVRMNVLFSYWYNGFYSALQELDQKGFWRFLGIFAVLATVHILRELFNFYVNQAFRIRWRVWLNERVTTDWMRGDAYYRSHFLDEPVDNPDQRIELDVNTFVSNSLTLALGAVSAVVSLVAFTGILWGLSAPIAVAGVEVPRAMVFAVYLYVIVATLIAFRLGQPLIRLNFLNERLTANFRYALVRVREYAENIAFYQGAAIERNTLLTRFSALIANVWALVYRSLKFDGFNLTVNQVAVVFPFLLQAPRFFSGAIKLGDVMQTSQAFGQVQDALSFFRTSYDTFAQYRAALDRLCGFLDANAQTRELPQVVHREQPGALDIEHLQVSRKGPADFVSKADQRAEQLAVDTHEQRRAATLGDLVDFTGQGWRQISAFLTHERQQRIHGPLAIHAPLIIDPRQARLGAERHGGQYLGGRFGLWMQIAQVLDDGFAFRRLVRQRCKQCALGQIPRGHARRCVNCRATTVAEGDGAGLVQQQDMHVPRRFHGAAGFGDHVQAHQTVHTGDTDGREQTADGGRNQRDQ